jgi:TRAP-type C4-dicarboxylate transport system permease small subunit
MRWLHRRIDDVMALMMAAMFAVFILQVIARYLAKYQIAGDFVWTLDFTSVCMVWIIFFGGAVALAESDHVKFDMLYNLGGPQTRRWLSTFTNLSIAAMFAWSLPAVWKYLSFLHMIGKPNATLKIPFSGGTPVTVAAIYSVYLLFAVVIIGRCLLRAGRLIAGAMPDDIDAPGVSANEDARP